jgi:hypothetical protein
MPIARPMSNHELERRVNRVTCCEHVNVAARVSCQNGTGLSCGRLDRLFGWIEASEKPQPDQKDGPSLLQDSPFDIAGKRASPCARQTRYHLTVRSLGSPQHLCPSLILWNPVSSSP